MHGQQNIKIDEGKLSVKGPSCDRKSPLYPLDEPQTQTDVHVKAKGNYTTSDANRTPSVNRAALSPVFCLIVCHSGKKIETTFMLK
jgi:hypothetical protein